MTDDYNWFIEKFHDFSGINLSLYKEKQMKRRLTTFCRKSGCASFKLLYDKITKSTIDYEALLDYITINVSEFFRNRQRWDVLETEILPQLSKKSFIKVWSAACSTGQEPYSLALLLSKYISDTKFKILATDIDKNVLEFAKRGCYSEYMLDGLSQKDILEFFDKSEEGDFCIKKSLRKTITFKQHNLLNSPLEGDFDLVVCRNVLIYFNEKAKEQIYRRFNEAMNEKGVLFVGSTEQIFNPRSYGFETIGSFFYQKEKI